MSSDLVNAKKLNNIENSHWGGNPIFWKTAALNLVIAVNKNCDSETIYKIKEEVSSE